MRYTPTVGKAGPGIADANRPRTGPFHALLERAAADPEALDALCFAYRQLPTAGRRHLAYAAMQDLETPGPALAAWLAIEPDGALAGEIARWLHTQGDHQLRATLTIEPLGGEACLLRPLLGFAFERMRVVWNDREIKTIEVESLVEPSFCDGPETPIERTVAVIAPKLWGYLRNGGTLPEGAARFAAFFSVG